MKRYHKNLSKDWMKKLSTNNQVKIISMILTIQMICQSSKAPKKVNLKETPKMHHLAIQHLQTKLVLLKRPKWRQPSLRVCLNNKIVICTNKKPSKISRTKQWVEVLKLPWNKLVPTRVLLWGPTMLKDSHNQIVFTNISNNLNSHKNLQGTSSPMFLMSVLGIKKVYLKYPPCLKIKIINLVLDTTTLRSTLECSNVPDQTQPVRLVTFLAQILLS